jgi:hypothetical protein
VKYNINGHQDFMASMHNDFFQGQMDRGLFYWLKYSGKAQLSNEEEEEEVAISNRGKTTKFEKLYQLNLF